MELSAFGVEFKQSKNEIEILDNRAFKKMLKKSRGFGRLNLDLKKLDKQMDLIRF